MNIDLARQMVRTAFTNGALLQELLSRLKEQCTNEEYRTLAHGIAEAIDKTNTSLISPALQAHPSLDSEIESSIKSTGSYR